jgi:bacterioferritin-associated ferredoxin
VIVCHCEVVSDRDVATALREGARNLSEVCRQTGAGQNCGTCIFSVKQLVCQHEQVVPGPLVEVDLAAS